MINLSRLQQPFLWLTFFSLMALNLTCKPAQADNTPHPPSASIIIPEQAVWDTSAASTLRLEDAESAWRLTQDYADLTPTFIEQAIEKPSLYFSQDNEAGSQRKAAQLLETMAKSGELGAAWNYCLRLRWLSPRIDLVAPVCREIGDSLLKDTSKWPPPRLEDLLPAQAARTELIVGSTLGEISRDYLKQPYDPARLTAVVISLDSSGRRDLASRLLAELYQIDSQCLWLRVAPGGLNGPLVNIARDTPG